MSQELNATEAAARLGVKKATLYAYVSRGVLGRRKAADGRASVFDRDEVEALRTGRRRAKEGEVDAVISTAITRVEDGDLRIRGRDLVAWVSDSGRFEDVVDWMWDGEADGDPWALPAAVAGAVRRVQEAMPDPSPLIDRLRVVAATVSATDPMRFDSSPRGVRSAARRLMLAMTMGLPLRGSEGAGDIADLLWPRLTRRRALPDRRASLNAARALLVDHGLASSTFAARIAASVRAVP
jgi:citrate synthase